MKAAAYPPWFREIEGAPCRISLTVHVQPGAARSEVVGEYGDALKVRIAAPAVDSKANDALLIFVVRRLGLSRQEVTLSSGETSRRKRLRISRLTSVEVLRALGEIPLSAG